MTEPYDRAEKRTLARRLAGDDDEIACPRCGAPVERRSVPPRREVAYVRDRVWIVCSGCGGSAVFDRRELEER